MRPLLVASLFASLPIALSAQTAIFPHGIVNVASYTPAGLPGGSIARGSIFAIFGTNIGPSTGVQVSTFPIAATLAGVSIQVTQGAATVAALPLYVSAGQINALMPSNTPLGLVSVRVTFNNLRTNPSTVRVVNSSFAFFSVASSGVGPGVFQNFVASDNQPVNSPLVTAKPGQVITAYGTGLGPVAVDNVAPTPGNLSTPVEVTVGGQPAKVLYSGRSPCCSGLDQIVFQVPDNTPSGCWVPVYLRTAGTTTSSAVTMAVDAQGSSCATDALTQTFLNGGKAGILSLVRTAVRQDVGVKTPSDITTDYFVYDLTQQKGGTFNFSPWFSMPPAGSCTIYGVGGDWTTTGLLIEGSTAAKLLDVGAFTINGPRGISGPQSLGSGSQAAHFGSAWSGSTLPNQLYLDPGSYSVAAAGGADAPAFQTSLIIPNPFTWTNRNQLGVIDRTQPLNIAWTGAAANQSLAIVGVSADLPTNSSAVFVCVAPSGASSITVPPAVLSALPASRLNAKQSKAVLYLGNLPVSNATRFTVSGLDAAAVTSLYMSGKTVTLK
ncbi:MAG TPA: hypothetical protein VEU96_05000 [Bryobacteraceae bacterium]|nr:hypothetical protein [Bryobacteraceae bacterium]